MRAFGSDQLSVSSVQKGFFLGLWTLFIIENETLLSLSETQVKTSCQKKKSCESSGFFERHAEGWHWYETVSEDDQLPETSGQKKKTHSPTERIETQRKELEHKLHAAIVEPNQENI